MRIKESSSDVYSSWLIKRRKNSKVRDNVATC